MLSNVKLTAANVPHKESLTTEEKATLWKNISSALIETGRPGIKRLLNWMQSDCGNGVMNYVNAPASTKYHGNYPGGLMEHSWNVYVWLTIIVGNANSMKDADAQLKNEESKAIMDSAAIVALLHDICKVGFYSMEPKNRKTYDAEKVKNALQKDVKHDSLGDFIWETVMSYTVTDTHKFGHGEASVAIMRNSSAYWDLPRRSAWLSATTWETLRMSARPVRSIIATRSLLCSTWRTLLRPTWKSVSVRTRWMYSGIPLRHLRGRSKRLSRLSLPQRMHLSLMRKHPQNRKCLAARFRGRADMEQCKKA